MINKVVSYYVGDRPEMIKFIPQSASKILDIGCGQGKFANFFVNTERDVWGVEINKDAAEIAKTKLNKVLVGAVEELIDDIPSNYFDVIIFNDVLEHLYDPWNVLGLLKSKLSVNGIIVSSIPNVRYITNLYDLVVKRNWEYKEFGILDSTHIRFFTQKTMITLFKSQGYNINSLQGIVKTKSLKGFLLATTLNILTLGKHRDLYYKQFVIIASK